MRSQSKSTRVLSVMKVEMFEAALMISARSFSGLCGIQRSPVLINLAAQIGIADLLVSEQVDLSPQ